MGNHEDSITRLKQALLECDMPAMQLAMIDLFGDEGPQEALRILENEVPEDIRRWWLEEECDLSHDPLDLEAETLPLVEHMLRQTREGET